MPRLQALDPASATERTHALFAAIAKPLGGVPNLMRTMAASLTRRMAASPAALEGYLGLSRALATGALPLRLRERLAQTELDFPAALPLTDAAA